MKRLALLLLVGLLLLPVAAMADGDNGTLSGKVVNKTANGSQVQPLEVTLKILTGENEETKGTVTTDAQGNFKFTGLATTSDRLYQVSAIFLGTEYRSEPVGFGPQESSKEVELPVYDTTESDQGIRIDRAHVIVDIDPESKYLRVMQIYSFVNPGDRAYIGKSSEGSSKRATVRLTVPGDAEMVQANVEVAPAEVSAQTMQVAVSSPIAPGQTDIVLSYLLAYTASRLSLRTSVPYEARTFDVYFVDVGAKASSSQLPKGDTFANKDSKFLVLSGESLPAGSPISIDFRSLPLGNGKGGIDTKWFIFGAIGIGAVLAAAYPIARRKRQPRLRPAYIAPVDDRDLEAERRDLVLALADLDDQLERGEIPEASYRALRAQKKHTLAELLARQREAAERQG
ncbi:MAG: hypothetical protein HY677_06535 [Chloroflexi bacterium]|nr:hypothetical protein [Chloroflexota bacterium]